MMLHSKIWSAVALASVVLATITVGGSPARAEGSLASGALPGNGFVTARITWEGEHTVSLLMTFAKGFSPSANGAAAIKPDGTSWGVTGVGSGIAGDHDCVVFSSQTIGALPTSCRPSVVQSFIRGAVSTLANSSESFAIQLQPGADAPGTYLLLNWQAYEPGEQQPAAWEIQGTPGDVAVLGITTGSSAYYASPSDFRGGTRVGLSAVGAFADVNSGSHLTIDIKHPPMAWMAPARSSAKSPDMMLRSPMGSITCSCSFALTGGAAGLPGTYDIVLDRLAAGQQGSSEAFVALVDPTFP